MFGVTVVGLRTSEVVLGEEISISEWGLFVLAVDFVEFEVGSFVFNFRLEVVLREFGSFSV